MAGGTRIINGEIAQGKLRGKAMAEALARQLTNAQNAGTKSNGK